MKKVLFTLAAVFGLSGTVSAQTPFFQDNFDNGKTTNANGFVWASTGGNVTVSPQEKFSGTHALRFRFPAKPNCEDAMAEQRFNMGRYVNEVWIEYMLYIPPNFKHRDQSAKNKICVPAKAVGNNKFIMLWRDKYSDQAGGTWRMGMEYVRGNDDFTSLARPMSSRTNFNSMSDGGPWEPRVPSGKPLLISKTGPLVIGQWNRVRFHVKAASSRTAVDGEYQMWVNDKVVLNYTKQRFHNFFDTPSDAVLRNGYLLGWSNSGFSEETLFFIDDVKFHDKNPDWK